MGRALRSYMILARGLVVLCFVVVMSSVREELMWSILYPYSSGFLHWHLGQFCSEVTLKNMGKIGHHKTARKRINPWDVLCGSKSLPVHWVIRCDLWAAPLAWAWSFVLVSLLFVEALWSRPRSRDATPWPTKRARRVALQRTAQVNAYKLLK